MGQSMCRCHSLSVALFLRYSALLVTPHSILATVEPVQLPAASARGWVVGANGSVEQAGLLGRRLLHRRALERRNVQDGPPLHSSRYCLARCATATACEEVRLLCLANRMVTIGGWGAGQWVAASIAAFPVAPIPDAGDECHASDHDE